MRADEAMKSTTVSGYDMFSVDYINQLRYERLMAKARELKNEAFENRFMPYGDRCRRIAEALEARARRIKEGM